MNNINNNIIWSSLPVAALLVDGADKISALNSMAETFLNTSAKSLINKQFSRKITVDQDLQGSFMRARNGQASLVLHEVKVSIGSRAPLTCNIQIAPLVDGSGSVLLLLQPRKIAGQLGQALKIGSANKTAIGLSDMLAHEIKNPLAGITGAAQLLAMNLSGEDQEMTDLIVLEARRILSLLEQVETFGDLRPPAMKPLNIHDILEQAKASANVGFAAHMRFSDNYDPSLPLIYGDEGQLLQVFSNLFKNAAEAANGKSGTITLKTYYEIGLRLQGADGSGHMVPLQIEITDDGPGIAPEMVERLFEPFVSGKENGTGLGLALVSKIITQHHGSVVVDSEKGQTVFRVSLPVSPVEKRL